MAQGHKVWLLTWQNVGSIPLISLLEIIKYLIFLFLRSGIVVSIIRRTMGNGEFNIRFSLLTLLCALYRMTQKNNNNMTIFGPKWSRNLNDKQNFWSLKTTSCNTKMRDVGKDLKNSEIILILYNRYRKRQYQRVELQASKWTRLRSTQL